MDNKINPQVDSIYSHPDNQSPTEINSEGTKFWRNSAGQRHREGDKPAVIYPDGSAFYYKEGKIHRDGDKPAVIYPDGSAFYYKEGKIHRDGDKPAVIYSDGSVFYYKEGKLHREGDKPARIYSTGMAEYWENDKLLDTGSLIRNKNDESSVVKNPKKDVIKERYLALSLEKKQGTLFYEGLEI